MQLYLVFSQIRRCNARYTLTTNRKNTSRRGVNHTLFHNKCTRANYSSKKNWRHTIINSNFDTQR